MSVSVRLRYIDSTGRKKVRVNPYLTKKWRISRSVKMKMKFGDAVYPVTIGSSSAVRTNEFHMSSNVGRLLRIPHSCSFKLKKEKNKILLGPFIGILLEKKGKKVPILELADYSKHYRHVSGALLAFSADDVNTHLKKIKGYMYNPATRSWVKGSYPYPSSVFNMARVKKSLINHLNKRLGKTIFNDQHLDKWKMYTFLSRNSKIRNHLPKTKLYQSTLDFNRMLQDFPEIYIKPINGSGGKRIWKVVRKRNQTILKHRVPSGRYITESFRSRKALTRYLRQQLHRKNYLIQEGVRLLSHKGRLIDFRMILVKSKKGKWLDMGLIARYGPKNSIVSNVSAGGHAEEGARTLRKVLGLRKKEITGIRNRMFQCAKRAAKQIKSRGIHLGNLGFDFGMDINKKIWIIEINHNDPDHTIALDAGQKQMYFKTIKTILLYAKSLAGF